MNNRHAWIIALALGGLASAHSRVADTVPALDPLVLVGVALVVAGISCWRHTG